MIHATLRESGTTLHHIQGEDMCQLLDTAGLIAEAINYRNGFRSGDGATHSLSVISEGLDGRFNVDEYLIREKGSFWLLKGSKAF